MKTKLFSPLLALAGLALSCASANAVTIFSDDFSTDTLSTNYITSGVTYNTTPETVTIARGSGSNFLQVAETFALDSFGSTTLTVSFNFSFGASMFGSGFLVQYNDGVGGWQTIASQNYTGTGANDLANATNFLTTTISENDFTFSDDAAVRIIGTTNSGGKGYHIDNLSIDVDVIPEPTTALLGGIGLLALLRRRR